jgi:hypothetical protein
MAYAFVFFVAVGVAVAVYVTTVRNGGMLDDGFGGGDVPSGPGATYVPVTEARTDWQSRLTGFLGLVIAVVVGAIVLAFGIYTGVSWLVRLVGNVVTGDDSGAV